jgi:hypothetical protein
VDERQTLDSAHEQSVFLLQLLVLGLNALHFGANALDHLLERLKPRFGKNETEK